MLCRHLRSVVAGGADAAAVGPQVSFSAPRNTASLSSPPFAPKRGSCAPTSKGLMTHLYCKVPSAQDLLAERSISSDKAAGAHDDTDIGVRGGFGLGNMINMVNFNLDKSTRRTTRCAR